MRIRTGGLIKVVAVYDPSYGSMVPFKVTWGGSEYTISEIGSYRKRCYGSSIIHEYFVTNGKIDFYLSFDANSLLWRLDEVDTLTH